LVIGGAAGMTLLFFLVLPLMQTLAKPPSTDLIVRGLDTADLPPPPPPPEEEEPEEEDEPEDAPELTEDSQPLDLSQLELALNPGFSDGLLAGDFTVNLKTVTSSNTDVDALFSLADLDQKPRVIYQPGPRITNEVRKNAPGTVYVIFIVDQQGRVANPIVQKSTAAVFEKPALDAVKQWKFEPGKRSGTPVRFRMRVPITFPEGL
jgi:protein TonB